MIQFHLEFYKRKEEFRMAYVSEIITDAPKTYKTPLQELTYKALSELNISFQRVDSDEIITMEDCACVSEKLSMDMVKTLLLCDRKQSAFYLFITSGEKHFSSKDFSSSLGISRVSFAPKDVTENMLGAKIGAATVFSVMLDKEKKIKVIFDRDLVSRQWYGCSDGTTTCYMKLLVSDILHKFLPYAGHTPEIIEV